MVVDGSSFDLDEEWARLARGPIPGFAGFHTDGSGNLVVSVSRAESERAAVEFVESGARSRRRAAVARSRLVKFGFDELKPWKDSIANLLDDTEIVWVDVDEVGNRLLVGVVSGPASVKVRFSARGFGIPDDALDVVVTERPRERVSYLTSRMRPVTGGLEIQFKPSFYSNPSSCTLGFNAYRNGVRGFVTNSHCSPSTFSTDYSESHQATFFSSNLIGTETYDPGGTRYSDAAFYTYDSGASSRYAHIARTTFSSVNADGSLEIDSVYPEFRIVTLASNSIQTVGEPLAKVGRTTGWTAGQVSQTCVTLSSRVCSWVAVLWSWDGDSGSPIFQQLGSTEPDASRVSLFGILWGGPTNDSSVTWYSPIAGVQADLGMLEIACDASAQECKPSPPAVSILGPSEVQQSQSCTWYSSVSGGALPLSYEWRLDNVVVSTATSYSTTDTGQSSFLLELRVTDGLQSVGFASLNVTVQGSGQFECQS